MFKKLKELWQERKIEKTLSTVWGDIVHAEKNLNRAYDALAEYHGAKHPCLRLVIDIDEKHAGITTLLCNGEYVLELGYDKPRSGLSKLAKEHKDAYGQAFGNLDEAISKLFLQHLMWCKQHNYIPAEP